jgi:hypothetical protein
MKKRNKEKKYGAYVDIRKHRWRANENKEKKYGAYMEIG